MKTLSVTAYIVSLLLLAIPCFAGTVYKYKDANGHWQFSDRPPTTAAATEQLEFAADPKDPNELIFNYYDHENEYFAEVTNPFFTPIEVKILFENKTQADITKVINAREKFIFYRAAQKPPAFKYQYVWGKPNTSLDKTPYRIPISSGSSHVISQGFNGRFSHNKEPSTYAVDIAVPVGTDIVAARTGTVIFVQDNFAMGGVQPYFLDKANAVYVLHDDGSYATYAHLLLGSAVVKAGQRIEAGTLIGQSGSSGFSSGPHLHFVIRQNTGFSSHSIPFTFTAPSGSFTPVEKQILCPCN